MGTYSLNCLQNMSKCFPSVSGIKVLVDPKSSGFSQFKDADTQLSVSSCGQNVVWCVNDYRHCIFTPPAVSVFKTDNAYHFYSLASSTCLWFCRQVLCRYVGRERILLVYILGDHLPAAFLLQCLDIHFVLLTERTRRCLPRKERRHKASILDPQSHVFWDSASISSIALWSYPFCEPW